MQQPDYAPLLKETVAAHKGQPLDEIVDHVLVRFGPPDPRGGAGRVSTEVDARLSFDTAATRGARAASSRSTKTRASRERVLIKIASTWEGIQAARILEHEGIRRNLTLLFAFCQGWWPAAMPACS